jgi:hypothetical protein
MTINNLPAVRARHAAWNRPNWLEAAKVARIWNICEHLVWVALQSRLAFILPGFWEDDGWGSFRRGTGRFRLKM